MKLVVQILVIFQYRNKNPSRHSLELVDSPGMILHDLGHGKQPEVLQVLVRILDKQAEFGHTQL